MSGVMGCSYLTRMYSALPGNLTVQSTAARSSSFLDMAAKASRDIGDALDVNGQPAVSETAETSQVYAYLEHLKQKYGRVTIESVGKDQASLERAGRRMCGNDVVIAPNILKEMASDPKKAAYYEQEIDRFFTDIIPKGKAFAASIGLTFEPCGVVVHEDGTVTYICGGGDSPERVAEVNRINAEKARKRAEQRRQYQEQAAAAAAQRRSVFEHTAETAARETAFSSLNELLIARMASAPAATPEAPFPAEAGLFFLNP